jgi:hypothetical protein
MAVGPKLPWVAIATWGDANPKHPLTSRLYALCGLPPLLVQVGEDESLLDDARRLLERARVAGGRRHSGRVGPVRGISSRPSRSSLSLACHPTAGAVPAVGWALPVLIPTA